MSTQNKQRNQKILLELALQPGNNICADCKARLPRWASYNLGIFICVNCASIHRKIGTHITKVKSLTMDDWTKEQVETMKSIGNINSNKIYNPNEIRNPPPPNLEESERDSEIEQYIRAKYEYKRFFDKSALVASKLGPPRSSSLAQQPPSASLPQPAPVPRSSAHTTKPYVAASTTSTSSYTAPAAPPKPPRTLPTAQPPQPSGGVWDDINSLKGNGQNSSLPLQYQEHTYSQGNHSMQLPAVNGTMGANNYYVGGTPPVIGLNSYQPNQVRTNPFSQQSSKPSLVPSSMTSNYSATQTMNSQPFGQQSYSVSQSSASLPVTPAYYEPQSQTSMQIQNPSGQAFISGPPSHLFPGPSAPPIGQSQFMPQSHDSIPQQHYTHSPHLMQSPSIPQGIYPPGPAPSQMGGHSVSGQHGQFSGLTTMQMQQMQMQQQQQQQMQQRQQQQIQIQQQQMPMQQQQQQQQMQQHQSQQLGQNYYSASMQPQMMSHQVNNAYNQTSTYPQGGFPPQTGGQW